MSDDYAEKRSEISRRVATNQEVRSKIAEAIRRNPPRLGAKLTEENNKKLQEGRDKFIAQNGPNRLGKKHSAESMLKASESHKRVIAERPESKAKSVKALADWIKKNGPHNKGKKLTLEEKIEMSARSQGVSLEAWTGFSKSERHRAMTTPEYKAWRAYVLWRDDYKCQVCAQRGGDLEADHIKPWAQFPELRYDVDNGQTLCKKHHRETPTYGNNSKRK